MGLLLTLTAGLVVWIVLWSLGAKSLDAIMITLVMVVTAVGGRVIAPFLPGNRPDEDVMGG